MATTCSPELITPELLQQPRVPTPELELAHEPVLAGGRVTDLAGEQAVEVEQPWLREGIEDGLEGGCRT